ncbi:sugar ABC transporter permease, partial [Streptomyces albiflaviniger]|nr:sugar ABC transporter permease [Streptomyces albiflaviniger]
MTKTAARPPAEAIAVRPAQAPPPAGGRGRQRLADQVRAYGFLLGGLICFALFSWYPAIRAVVIAFQKYTPGSSPEWVGTANFTRVLHDPEFTAAWRNTLTFTLLALLIGFAIPFLLALVLNELRHAKAFFRVVVYLPVMIPPVVSALLWKWFYDPGAGLANEALRWLHLPTSNWSNGADTALISLVIVATWANMGGTVLIYLAALQSIPGELYEAAELD